MNVEPKIKNGVGIGKNFLKIENRQKTAKKRLRRKNTINLRIQFFFLKKTLWKIKGHC